MQSHTQFSPLVLNLPSYRAPPFTKKPALRPIMEFLVQDSVKRYAVEKCSLCSRPALPEDPEVRKTKL